MTSAPIVLFVYNRPCHVEQTLEALQNNLLASESELFIYSDASKHEDAAGMVAQVRKIIHAQKGFRKITVIEREKNLGLANSVIDGVTNIVNKYGKVIVLEDDMVTSPYFLRFMNENLDMYEEEDKVVSIHGYVYPIKEPLPETFFLRGADCWGWATWKKGWDIFEPDGTKLLLALNREELVSQFDFNNSYPYYRMLEEQVSGKNDSWAIRWYASAFLAGKLTLYPGESYVNNIGNDNSGTHAGKTKMFDIKIKHTPPVLMKIEPEENKNARKAFERYFAEDISFGKRVYNFITKLIK